MASQNGVFKEKYGSWALVTGASSGIGKAFAGLLAAQGLNLVLVARRKKALDQIAQDLKNKYPIQIKTVQADLSEPTSILAIDEATKDLEIGLLLSNAGTGVAGAFLKSDPAIQANLIHLNVTAHMQLAHRFGQQMSQRGRGGIILVSSIGAYQGMPYMANYSAAKAYILNLGEALHFELKPKGIDVTVLVPGATDTEAKSWEGLAEAPKMSYMTADQVAKTALKALGKKPSIIPGGLNKVMNFISTRFIPRSAAASMFGSMMKKSVAIDRL